MVDQSLQNQGPAQTVKFWRINKLKDIERFYLRLNKDNEIYNSPGKKEAQKFLGLFGFWQ